MSEAKPGRIPATREMTVEQAVGQRVRELRIERGWTQIQLAQAVTVAGLTDWRRGTVTSLEAGHRQITWAESFLLAHVFGVPAADLFPVPPGPGDETKPGAWALRLGPRAVMRPDVARWHLTGGSDGLEDHTARFPQGILATAPEGYGDFLMERDDANRKAAEALHIDVDDLMTLSVARWAGMTLPRERDRRLANVPGADQLPLLSRRAHRGHITRTLLAELRTAQGLLKLPISEYSDLDALRTAIGRGNPPIREKRRGRKDG
jgi:transcriptional regulator with XRE-family HTH domain